MYLTNMAEPFDLDVEDEDVGQAAYQTHYQEAFDQTYSQGESFGKIKGIELASEFGQILAFLEILQSEKSSILTNLETSKQTRILRSCEKTSDLIQNFNCKPSDLNFNKSIEQVRSSFKQISVMCKKLDIYSEIEKFFREVKAFEAENNVAISQQIVF